MRVGGGRRWRLMLPVSLLLLLSLLVPALGAAQSERTLVPIGGGYTTTSLEEFSRLVIEHADGDIVLILVNPSSYGDDPDDRAEDIDLAEGRTQQIEDACNSVLVDYDGFTACDAQLLLLFDRNDALNEANSALYYDEETDGSYILGGDQGIAMHVLANSPAEEAMQTAYENGVVFGGTSAGAAIESQDMINGYTDDGWPYNALEREMVIIWWANDGDDERGLIFGSETIIFDQHFYERGRFGRLLNIVAQSDEQYAGESRLGVGVDYGTGVALTNESILSGVFGDSSIAIIDGETLETTFEWNGPNDTLSARELLTHIVGPHPVEQLTYDADRRMPVLDGEDLAIGDVADWPRRLLNLPGRSTLLLGGDMLESDGAVFQDFLHRVKERRSGDVVVIGVGTESVRDNQLLAANYAAELDAQLNANYSVSGYGYGSEAIGPGFWSRLVRASGVVFVGGDQSLMAEAVADDQFRMMVRLATLGAPLVMTDGAMTAVMGDWYVTDPDPTDDDYQDVGIEDFKVDGVTIAPGLGVIEGAAFEPLVTWDQRWGRLYNLAAADPETLVFGISENTALVLSRDGASVLGERSVINLDGRQGTYLTSDNGALTALNVVMNLYAPGDLVE